jgi:hypothetical protein
MNNTMETYATKYPAFYKKIYWGGFRSRPHETIIENRNAFIKATPGIRPKKWLKRVREKFDKQMESCNLDHNEFYHTSSHWVMITSPYDCKEETTALFLEKGFKKIEPLYSTQANTFIFTVPKE